MVNGTELMQNVSFNATGIDTIMNTMANRDMDIGKFYSLYCNGINEHILITGIVILIIYILWKWFGMKATKNMPLIMDLKFKTLFAEHFGDVANNEYDRLEVYLLIENLIIKFMCGWMVLVIYLNIF